MYLTPQIGARVVRGRHNGRGRDRLTRAACMTGLILGLGACASVPAVGPDGLYAHSVGGAPVTANDTPYSAALACMANYARATNAPSPRIAVGRITDYTGKQEDLQGGPKLTQGASLMAITALAKAGASLVERYDTSVSEHELKYANGKLISDAGQAPGDYRKSPVGALSGSDFVLIGGITELNFNLRSTGADGSAGGQSTKAPKGTFHRSVYVMNVGIDLRLVDTRTSNIVDVISYQKQIVGREVSAGVFSFLGSAVIDLSAGSGALEPLQPGPEICLRADPLSTTYPIAELPVPYRTIGNVPSWPGRYDGAQPALRPLQRGVN